MDRPYYKQYKSGAHTSRLKNGFIFFKENLFFLLKKNHFDYGKMLEDINFFKND
jgi:hypothetical protein